MASLGIEERAFISWKGSDGGVTLWTRIERRPRDFFITELFRKFLSFEKMPAYATYLLSTQIFFEAYLKIIFVQHCHSQLRKKNFIGCRSRSMNNQPLEVILKDETTNVSKFAWFFFPFRINKRLDKTRLMDRLAHITQRATPPPLVYKLYNNFFTVSWKIATLYTATCEGGPWFFCNTPREFLRGFELWGRPGRNVPYFFAARVNKDQAGKLRCSKHIEGREMDSVMREKIYGSVFGLYAHFIRNVNFRVDVRDPLILLMVSALWEFLYLKIIISSLRSISWMCRYRCFDREVFLCWI